ncbi:VanW family protein [Deinococcus sonorensis]|uniref:VanW family protein n=2 Tax=Deinococcus sonorensis TaxID=309891 RepID=A0AAU7UED5_9DEIO
MKRPGVLGWLLAGLGLLGPAVSAPRPALSAPGPARLRLVVVAPEPTLHEGRIEQTKLRRTLDLTLPATELAAWRSSGTAIPAALRSLYRQLETRTPQDARFFPDAEGGWTARAQTGWTVNRAVTGARVRQALQDGGREVQVALRFTPPTRTVQRLLAAGVRGHIGSGRSAFTGSPAFRVQNIRVGSALLSGQLLQPGEVFDFNRALGPIQAGRGFVPGYVITGGTLSLEDGGGICQVSTTLFRAAYTAGLPIVERHAHSHQVAYYDPPGFEATVYAPTLNFRFRNDTAGALLVQASWNLKAQTLQFDLFGVQRRVVSVSAPRVSGVIPASPPGFLADPRVAPGQAVRVDMPAQGATVRIERRITLPDGRVRHDQLLSRYRPWGGVFAVPPGDPRLKR